MIIISNSSPIIALNNIGKLDILKRLYNKIIIPDAVKNEITVNPIKRIEINNFPWITIKSLSQPLTAQILSAQLGHGESEVLGLALELKSNLIIIDETAARNIANLHEIKYTGTLGILLKAKKQAIIRSVKEPIDELNNNGFRISNGLYQYILELAKEN